MKAAFTPLASETGLPISIAGNRLISTWISIDAHSRTFRIYSGKVELGQNILTAIGQIAAHELRVSFECIEMVRARTGLSPDESITSGSLSIQHSGMAVRLICRRVRHLFVVRAAAMHSVAPESITVAAGTFYSDKIRVGDYWELAKEVDLDVFYADDASLPEKEIPYVSASVPALGITEKSTGRYGFIHDMLSDRVLHGRILRPPSIQATLIDIDATAVEQMKGVVAIARDGSLVGVLAEHEYIAERAVVMLGQSATWQEADCLPDPGRLGAWMREQACDTIDYADAASAASGLNLPGREDRNDSVYEPDYDKPFIKHASIGPSCAYAICHEDDRLHVWTHSQGVYNLRTDLALVFGVDEQHIVVEHVPGAGCYGHNGADDVAFDAAWLSRYAKGRQVRIQWSRADELCWSPQGPAMSMHLKVRVDKEGRIQDWQHQTWSPGHSLRPGRAPTSTLLGSWYQARAQPVSSAINAPIVAGGGTERNLIPSYDLPCSRLASHRVLHMPVRTSSLRCLGAFGNVFAIESMLDTIAADFDIDPIDYRLGILSDPRAINVLQEVRRISGWPGSTGPGHNNDAVGWGVGYARYKNKGAYCAVVAKVLLGHRVVVDTLFIAVDVGEIINPDGVMQQIEGGAIQATSWATMEEAHFSGRALMDDDWQKYPVIRFSDVPDIEISLLDQPDQPPVGAGEPSLAPTAAAIANAIHNAIGVRLKQMPMTFERINQTIQEQV
ncbi:molybdopterin cofactor-binding domain-containing protein [Advenella kashmirensis]|uniref:molybdopterin cofactor-binding domain-containing protein n=1 Tax=Advenella kashmirensis TaxID=310575 RepID=UPI000428F7CF|nr:molybdopterin cofactor-binding domain-containing protein [Advenella kashmirensis]